MVDPDRRRPTTTTTRCCNRAVFVRYQSVDISTEISEIWVQESNLSNHVWQNHLFPWAKAPPATSDSRLWERNVSIVEEKSISGADSQNSERRGRVPPPPLWRKTSLFRRWSIQHCGRLRGAKWSNVNVSKYRIKEHLTKRLSGRLEGLGSNKNVLKKGGHGPLGPSPKSAHV